MQFKSITAIIVLSLVVASLLVAGCTSSTTNTGNNSSQNPSVFPTDKSDLSKDITASVKNGYLVVKEFTKSTNQYGNVVYTGVVKDNNETSLSSYQYNITIELTKNKTETLQRVPQLIAIYDKLGYYFPSKNATRVLGNKTSTDYVYLGGCDANLDCLGVLGKTFGQFTVYTEEKTKLE